MGAEKKRVDDLLAVASGKTRGIVMPHDHADPDAIAAAMGVSRLFRERLKLNTDISFEGAVGREENRILCESVGIEVLPTSGINFDGYDLVTLVDCQPGIGNNSLPKERQADIVIDHHPIKGKLKGVSFIDIRDNCGSSSTIVTEYLASAGLIIDSDLATALLYGIKTDAMNFFRKTRETDIRAYLHLFPLADGEKLNRIESASLYKGYFKVLHRAIEDVWVYGNVLISGLGAVNNPGLIGEFADLFLRLEEVTTTLCYGVYEGRLLLSVRTLDSDLDAGKIIRYAVGKRGTAGGHATMAGGQIPLQKKTEKEEKEHIDAVLNRLFSQLGVKKTRKRRIA